MWRCNKCESTEVEVQAWIKPNEDNVVTDFIVLPGESIKGYCQDCDGETTLWNDRAEEWSNALDIRTLQELNDLVLHWANNKGILQDGKPITQAIKTLEECHELLEAINRDDKPAIRDAIGDIIVTLISQAYMQETSIRLCLSDAYDVIKQRTGQLDETGNFIKDK